MVGLGILAIGTAFGGEGVRYRGIFINDEDWGLRPWAVKHYGKAEQIGTNAYAEVFKVMQTNGLNLLWPAMHEGGYEFSARPENLALADKYGITIGTSHCEPMLRNNCYLSKADKTKWSYAGLKVPDETIILWTNDNFGYVRRLGGPQVEGRPQGIYWHASYYGNPHSYTHLCTTPPAFMWYELCAKAWNNGVRDVWMLNVGDVFPAELLLHCYGQLAANPNIWEADSQDKLLAAAVERLGVGHADLERRIVAHLTEYYTLGFNRRPEHMCLQWTTNLPQTVKTDLLKRYKALLAEDREIERQLSTSTSSLDLYFKLIGFQAQFLAQAGIIHLEGRDKAYAHSVLDPLMARWDALEGGKWSGLWCDTIDEHPSTYQPTCENRWSSQMQWPWNEPADPVKKDRKGVARCDYVATAYRANVPEPTWLEPVAKQSANGGAWTRVSGLGTSGKALALLPVKPGIGKGATLTYVLPSSFANSLILQFLPDFALWPGLKLGVNVQFEGGKVQYVAVPKSDSNLNEKDPVRAVAVQDNFIRVSIPIPDGAKRVKILAADAGVVIDKVGVKNGN